MEKIFKLGLVLGRYNHIHSGHTKIIDQSRKLCQKTLILIGSAQESGTVRNPFKLETRKKTISKVYQTDDVIIGELKDYTNENDISTKWGKYILDNIKKDYKTIPDLMVYGKDDSRNGWFSKEDSQNFSELIVSRNKNNFSATEIRKYMAQDNKKEWKKYVPKEIWDMYDELREELMKIDFYKELGLNNKNNIE